MTGLAAAAAASAAILLGEWTIKRKRNERVLEGLICERAKEAKMGQGDCPRKRKRTSLID
jgi:hypothetical protein